MNDIGCVAYLLGLWLLTMLVVGIAALVKWAVGL